MRKFWRGLLLMLSGLLLINVAIPTVAASVNANQALVQFIEHKMTGKDGIYTNYLATSNADDSVATGHQYLSESAGYYLQYLAQTKQKRKFRAFYKQTKRTFYRQSVFLYRFDPHHPEKYQVNATIDDLRIIAALLKYDDINHTTKYQTEIKRLYKGLSSQVKQAGLLTDMYSLTTHTHNQTVTLCYQDLAILRRLDQKSYRKAVRVVTAGKISHRVPLYYQSYQLKTGHYSQAQLVTPQLLITFLHLAEVGKLPSDSLNWLKQRVATQTLYNAYSLTGQAKNHDTAAANYALALMIGQTVHDQQLSTAAEKVLLTMQVTDQNSPLYGSFGDPQTKQVYSFNELTALVALNQ